MAVFGRNLLGDPEQATKLEWLVTNGLGGFACSTLVGLNTRRYHGILVAARRPPVERIVMVSRLEETILVGGEEYDLSSCRYRKALHPCGHVWLQEFRRDPIPTWIYQIGNVLVSKSLCMVYGQNTTLVTYKVLSPEKDVEFRIRPHMLFRDFHGNTFQNPGFEDNTEIRPNGASIQPFGNAPRLHIAWDRGEFVRDPNWYLENFLAEEEKRGLDPIDDDFSNGYLGIKPFAGSVSMLLSDQPIGSFNPVDLRKREELRLESVASGMKSEDAFLRQLLLAADQFIVERRSTGGKTIIAGYPWFSDWGRDSLISLTGLTLVTGKAAEARSILKTFASAVKDGLVPNCFADQGTDAMYNSVDASLWFFFAVYKFIEYTDDYAFVRETLYKSMGTIIESFIAGTRFNIHVDPDDGLVSAGEPKVQLTWMDAKVDDWVVTPRHGKAVEINALWYNALRIQEMLCEKFQGDAREISALARKVKSSFRAKFTNPVSGGLYDCIGGDGIPDPAFRPNQIYAVFLPFSLLDPQQEKTIVNQVFRHLYTSHGLRSLSPQDPLFVGKYQGNRLQRDRSYHQGTVWAFLVGPFITSFLKVHNHSMEAQVRASYMIEPFRAHLEGDGCIGSISEIFDGNPPHRANGCFAQAWSVAEILRCYVEDIKGQKPTLMV